MDLAPQQKQHKGSCKDRICNHHNIHILLSAHHVFLFHPIPKSADPQHEESLRLTIMHGFHGRGCRGLPDVSSRSTKPVLACISASRSPVTASRQQSKSSGHSSRRRRVCDCGGYGVGEGDIFPLFLGTVMKSPAVPGMNWA